MLLDVARQYDQAEAISERARNRSNFVMRMELGLSYEQEVYAEAITEFQRHIPFGRPHHAGAAGMPYA